jgi:DNA polymerase-3 subunit beta
MLNGRVNMKFTCEKYLIQAAVSTASRAAAVKSPVISLEGLLIEAVGDTVTISGYDLKTGITTKIPADVKESGDIVLNARLLGEIIRKMPGDDITISVSDNFMTKITGGMSEFEIMATPADDYPELPVVDYANSISIKQKTLKSMISQTCFAVSDNEARPILTGALFEAEGENLTVVAVDGYRLALRKEPLEEAAGSSYSFVVPGTALSEVEKIVSDSEDTVSINIGLKHIMFKIGDTVLISRRLEGEFLNYRKSVPMSGKFDVKASSRSVIEAVERVSLIISDKLKSPVRCTFDENVLRLVTSTTLGKASDECPVEGNAEGLEIGFNNKYLLDALKAAPADDIIIRLSSGTLPCLILPTDGGDNFLYMVLPVRLKSNEN